MPNTPKKKKKKFFLKNPKVFLMKKSNHGVFVKKKLVETFCFIKIFKFLELNHMAL